MSNIRLGIGRRWRNSIRDCDGAFGLDPSKQYLVCRGVEPLRDLIDWLVYGTARLARDRAVVYCLLSIKPANAKKGGSDWWRRTSEQNMLRKRCPGTRCRPEVELDAHTRRGVAGSSMNWQREFRSAY
jgi:hypothetical protein